MPIDFDAVAQKIIEAAEKGAKDAADVIKQDAIERAPAETGELRNSCQVDHDGLNATIYFDTPYAVAQHEELDWDHEVGEAKYLENALIDNREVAGAVIAEAIRQAL